MCAYIIILCASVVMYVCLRISACISAKPICASRMWCARNKSLLGTNMYVHASFSCVRVRARACVYGCVIVNALLYKTVYSIIMQSLYYDIYIYDIGYNKDLFPDSALTFISPDRVQEPV